MPGGSVHRLRGRCQRGREEDVGGGGGGGGITPREHRARDIQPDTTQGTSEFIDPGTDEHIVCIAHIYFPTNGTSLDSDDIGVLNQVRALYPPTRMLGRRLNLYVTGTADWRPADNDRLARVRARTVRRWLDNNIGNCNHIPENQDAPGAGEGTIPEHGTNCNALYSSYSVGRGVSGTRADGLTAEQLNRFRAAHVYARIGPVPPPSNDIQTPGPQPPAEPLVSTHFKMRILQSCGMDIPLLGLSGNYTVPEIVDTTNNIRRIFEVIGPGIGAGLPANISGASGWQAFTTTVPMNVNDFRGPMIHFVLGLAARAGWVTEVFHLIAPVIYGGDSVRIEFPWTYSVGATLNIGFGIDFGGLEPTGLGWSRVPRDYTTRTNPPYPLPWETFEDRW